MVPDQACKLAQDDTKVGARICSMSHDEFEALLKSVAKNGAKEALADIGLGDKNAGPDIRTIRDILKGFRLFKRETWRVAVEAWGTILKGIGRVIGWAIVLGIAAVLFKFNGPTAREIAQKLVEP